MRDLNVTSLPVAFQSETAYRFAMIAIFAAGSLFGFEGPLSAQHGQPGGPRSNPPPPNAGLMPGQGMPPVPGGQQRTKPVPGAKGGPELKPIDSETLPKDFVPPAEKNPLMELDQPLAPPDEINKLKREIPKYQQVLRTARVGDAEKALIRGGIRYRLAEICQPAQRPNLTKLHEDFARELNSAGQAPDNVKTVREFRTYVLQELLSQAAPLIDNQNFYVRLHLILLLGRLDITEENSRIPTKQEAFVGASGPLMKVLLSPEQHEALKIAAANGLARILRLGTPDVLVRTNIANALIAELKSATTHPWYQMRLVAALGLIDVELDQARKPFIVDTLKQILASKMRTWQVRSEAAYALGRVPLPAACDPPSVPRAIGAFTVDLAKAAQQAPAVGNLQSPKWKAEFTKVYLAFQQKDKDDMSANKQKKAGLLNSPEAQAKPIYNLIVPLVSSILNGQRLTVQQVQSLEQFLGPAALSEQPDKPNAAKNDAGSSSTTPRS